MVLCFKESKMNGWEHTQKFSLKNIKVVRKGGGSCLNDCSTPRTLSHTLYLHPFPTDPSVSFPRHSAGSVPAGISLMFC